MRAYVLQIEGESGAPIACASSLSGAIKAATDHALGHSSARAASRVVVYPNPAIGPLFGGYVVAELYQTRLDKPEEETCIYLWVVYPVTITA